MTIGRRQLDSSPDRDDYGETLPPGARSMADYAASSVPSRGREHAEQECTTRSPFQRDRDRILHSTPFRRLTYKTQVFVFHEGDHYRTRLTHSLEVAQIARTVARQLRLDEDLAEALALAHDLGHSPFGHAGERALDHAMTDYGGFDHNAQSLRVVMRLERKYLGFDGLNLTWETLEGLAKHNGPVAHGPDHPVAKVLRVLERWRSLELDQYASAEAQVAALSDDIAYVNHDIDDALRAGLLSIADIAEAPLAGEVARNVQTTIREHDDPRVIYEITRRMITIMISDCVDHSRQCLRALAPRSPDDIRRATMSVVAFSPELEAQIKDLKRFMFDRVYRHPRVMRVMTRAETIVCDLFQRYLNEPDELPEAWRSAAQGLSDRRYARLVGDFVSGMTDRLAIAEHRRLFDATPELR
ncbi:Deoxyguanosinetriphosphate triphosphohydrolase-like protein 1 [Candidatus Filomicrobium marinum]|uniref:Deoxyguanosinetriphosphate triphosphohydrolase-like protein n=1 Tax=Candidatus Filomicrobium marinum TaxID=1608628 RepID=A0A0D6JGW8_9HYPH|nr:MULTISPECIES: deoxyguanosinetriphosphate triphosphohydrolase [Filomicrobium]MCV0369715.1 deoxyguanosinetriphosphate triphosphohydrolase [Filomicrobium sp.]CFX48611.1 Deoxyguanosinetriphosphate triphosphohydrolase-like protein 1 [Candidatus Filomicrobium marinum]CPR20414.1 Deoxyguanosinetriphosphate triphosphohydrolase-like protein 1 [Candidatus Filomicrobium marinum]